MGGANNSANLTRYFPNVLILSGITYKYGKALAIFCKLVMPIKQPFIILLISNYCMIIVVVIFMVIVVVTAVVITKVKEIIVVT